MRWIVLISVLWAGAAMGDAVTDRQWTYVSDRVMGGISDSTARIIDGTVLLEGKVSTANNGGFIQIRTNLRGMGLSGDGLSLRARGNGETYYIHIRTPQTRRPWHYFRAEFTPNTEWTNIRLPWTVFEAANRQMPTGFAPATVTSLGLVAYGRDHTAELWVSDMGTFSLEN